MDLSSFGAESVIDLIAGGFGGVGNVYAGQPLDTVKVKLQAFPDKYTSMSSCFMQTLRQDGIRGLYAGSVPALAANIAENSIIFCVYEMTQKPILYITGIKHAEDLPLYCKGLSGSCAAVFASMGLCPTELIKCRLQADKEVCAMKGLPPSVKGPIEMCKIVWKQDGIAGFYRGLVSTLAREVPGYFFFFSAYELTKRLLLRPGETNADLGVIRLAMCGSAGGVALWTAIFPADVVKSRSQLQSGKSMRFSTTLLQIYRTEGILALYNGLLPTVIRTIPACSALIICYETSRKWMYYGYFGSATYLNKKPTQ